MFPVESDLVQWQSATGLVRIEIRDEVEEESQISAFMVTVRELFNLRSV